MGDHSDCASTGQENVEEIRIDDAHVISDYDTIATCKSSAGGRDRIAK